MRQSHFASFEQFREELLRYRTAPIASSLEEMADDLIQGSGGDDFESLWDPIDADSD